MKLLRLILAFTLLGVFSASTHAQADERTVGFEAAEFPTSLLNETQLGSKFLFREVSRPLLSTNSAGVVRLRIADSFSISADFKTIVVRVRGATRFSNGEPIYSQDVVFSLERCKREGKLSQLKAVKVIDEGSENEGRGPALEITLSTSEPDIGRVLGECPVLDSVSTQRFGTSLGLGSNMISAGSYEIVGYQAGKSYQLAARDGERTTEQTIIPTLLVKSYPGSAQLLAGLRAGEVLGFYTRNTQLMAEVDKDDTLRKQQCTVYWAVVRKGNTLPCLEHLDPREVQIEG